MPPVRPRPVRTRRPRRFGPGAPAPNPASPSRPASPPARAALLFARRAQSPRLGPATPGDSLREEAAAGGSGSGGRSQTSRHPAPPPGPSPPLPPIFFPGKLSRAGPGGSQQEGCLQVSSPDWGNCGPPPQLPAPPSPRARGPEGGSGRGRHSSSQTSPRPRAAPRRGTAPGARPARGPERKKLIIDWVIGVAGAPNGQRTRARAGLRGRGGAGSPTGAAAQRDDPRAVAAERQPEQERRGRRRIDELRARLRLPGQLAGRERGGRGGAGSGRCRAAGRGLQTAAGP